MYKFLLISYFFPLFNKFKYCENTIILLAKIKSESSESTITKLSNTIVAIVRFPPQMYDDAVSKEINQNNLFDF